MNLFSRRLAVLVGLGLLSAGCAAEPIVEETIAAPALNPLDGPAGTHGTNGLMPLEYQPLRSKLDALLMMPLMDRGEMNPDPAFTDFLASASGTKVFTYAVQCALPADMNVGDFKGAGLLATTESWVKAPLDPQQRRDVHTCIVTRLNPLDEHVNLWIGGPDTAKDTSPGAYGYAEAVWSVDIDVHGNFAYSVWPLDTFTALTVCGSVVNAVADDFNSRLCDENGGLCGLTVRTDMATVCTGTPGHGDWVCNGKPAIETRLGEQEWDLMHPVCPIKAPPPSN